MSDDLEKKKKDADFISLTETWEVRDWCKELGVTEDELRKAVKAVGNSVKEVKKYLGK